MKRALLLFAVAGGLSLGCLKADGIVVIIPVGPTGTLTLDGDKATPDQDGLNWDWTYTLTVTNGNLSDVSSVDISDVGGVVGVSAPRGWTADDTPAGGGGYNVTFEPSGCLIVCIIPFAFSNSTVDSVDGFTIESSTNLKAPADYSVVFGNSTATDPTVGAPSVNGAVPEPASITLLALVLLGAGGGLRRKLR